jgi:hypothetical protein
MLNQPHIIGCQGDQIGISPMVLIVYFARLLENYTSNPHFWATLFHGLVHTLILTKIGIGYVLGDIFSSQIHLVVLLAVSDNPSK